MHLSLETTSSSADQGPGELIFVDLSVGVDL